MSDRRQHRAADPFDTKMPGGVLNFIGYVGLGLTLAAIVAVVVLYFLPRESWKTVPGNVIAIRAVPTLLGGETARVPAYRAEVFVQYSVNGQQYTFWDDPAAVATDAEEAKRGADRQYEVAYNPKNPKQARIIRRSQ